MSIIERMRDDLAIARKHRNELVRTVLVTNIAELEAIGKNDGDRETTDAEVVRKLKKVIETAKEVRGLALGRDPDANVEKYDVEVLTLLKYLPAQMSDDAILENLQIIMGELEVTDKKGLRKVLGEMRKRFDGQYDGALAKDLLVSLLA